MRIFSFCPGRRHTSCGRTAILLSETRGGVFVGSSGFVGMLTACASGRLSLRIFFSYDFLPFPEEHHPGE